MENKKTYIVKYDSNGILDNNFDKTIKFLVDFKGDVEVVFIENNSNIIDSNINVIVNKYIQDCRKADNKRGVGVNKLYIKDFVLKMIKILAGEKPNNFENSYDILLGGRYFVVDDLNLLPEIKENLLHLGLDYILGVVPMKEIAEKIIPEFYYFLYKNDLLDDEKYNRLNDYQIGVK